LLHSHHTIFCLYKNIMWVVLLWSIAHWLDFILLIICYKISSNFYECCFRSRYNRNDSKSNYNFFDLHMHRFWTLCILIIYLFQLFLQTYGYHSRHITYNVFPNQFTQLVANWIPYKN
jgi:hypothetical protein